jgi:sphingomyelin phosphodiesterase 2
MCHRIAQAWEIAKLMKGAVDRGHLVLGLGDFNAIPLSLVHRIVCKHGAVRDVWRVLHPDSSVGMALDLVEQARRRPIPTAGYNLTENGAASDNVLNTWRWDKRQQKMLGPGRPPIEIPLDTMDPRAKRLDYIFASSGSRHGKPGGWTIKDARVGMTGRHPILQCSLSDHFAVEATIEWHPNPYNPDPHKNEDVAVESGAFLQSPTNSEYPSPVRDAFYNTQLKPVKEDAYLPIQTYNEILDMIAKYNIRERKQRRYRLYHFLASVIISIACLIAVWFSPRNLVAFLLMLLSTLGLSAGVIDGLIGGLFMGSEIRALKEFEWEIRNARAAAGAGIGGGELYEALQEW